MKLLTFAELRAQNTSRAIETFGHNHLLNDWSPTDWGCALAGEVGELCNLLKKWRRKDFVTASESELAAIGDEIADVQIYLDLLASSLKMHLDEVLVRKFNIVSERMNSVRKL